MTRRRENSEIAWAPDAAMARIDQPIVGFYRVKLVKNGPWCSARLWYGVPADPLTGEPLDRSPRWQALRAGNECALNDLWPWCHGNEIDKAEYNYLLSVEKWAVNAPDAPEHDPRKAIDLNKLQPIF